MSKRNKIVVIICIVVAALSFMGGMIYKYEDYKPMVDMTPDLSKYYFEFIMPIEKETAIYWLDWARDYHTFSLESDPNRDDSDPYRYHEDAIEMYKDMKVRALQFYDKWEKPPW